MTAQLANSAFRLVNSDQYQYLVLENAQLTAELIDKLFEKLRSREPISGAGQRGEVLRLELPGVGRCVARLYRRGGAVQLVSTDIYLGIWRDLNKRRPGLELSVLAKLANKGVSVPRPVAAISTKGFFYRGILITEEIPEAKSLYQMWSGSSGQNVEGLIEAVAVETYKMLSCGIMHPDLHPGNVLLSKGRVFLIDFDRAHSFPTERCYKYAVMLIERWERAVSKWGWKELDGGLFRSCLAKALESNFK